MKQKLLNKLDAISRLAEAPKWRRLLYAPQRYISGQFFFRVVYQRSKKGKLVKTNTFFGKEMNVLLPAGMDIYLLGAKTHDSEIRLTKWMLHNLQPGNVVLDIGVHFGFYSLLASSMVGNSGHVIGIEASRAVYEVCTKNLSGNSNISLFHLAASHENGPLFFYEFPVLFSEYNTIDPGQFQDSSWVKDNPPSRIEVEGKRMDELLHEKQLIPDFIKIDVEGAEDKVISGLQNTLEKYSPTVALEYLSDQRTNKAHAKAAQQLIDLGYTACFIDAGGQLKPSMDIERDLLNSGAESDNLIFTKSIKT